MLSFSYRSFLIMDQLRRKASISVAQLNAILGSDWTTYSRLSKRVYANECAVLHYSVEKRVLHTVNVLVTAFCWNAISQTTIKQPSSIVYVLKDIERKVVADADVTIIDADIAQLLNMANKVLNT